MATVLSRTVPAVPSDVLKWCVDRAYSLVSSKVTNDDPTGAPAAARTNVKMIGRLVKGTPGAFEFVYSTEEASATGIIVGPIDKAVLASIADGATTDAEYAILYRGPALYDNLIEDGPDGVALTIATAKTALATLQMIEVENPPVTGTQDT